MLLGERLAPKRPFSMRYRRRRQRSQPAASGARLGKTFWATGNLSSPGLQNECPAPHSDAPASDRCMASTATSRAGIACSTDSWIGECTLEAAQLLHHERRRFQRTASSPSLAKHALHSPCFFGSARSYCIGAVAFRIPVDESSRSTKAKSQNVGGDSTLSCGREERLTSSC